MTNATPFSIIVVFVYFPCLVIRLASFGLSVSLSLCCVYLDQVGGAETHRVTQRWMACVAALSSPTTMTCLTKKWIRRSVFTY